MQAVSPRSIVLKFIDFVNQGDLLEYKYTRDSWDVVEKDAACGEISNRTAIVVYGLDGTMTLEDTVENWRNTGPCGD